MSNETESLRTVLATMRDILGDQRNFACECIIFANQEDPEKHRPSCPWRACSEGAAALAIALARLEASEDAKIMATADRMTLGDGRDFSLAAYMVRDLPTTKTANLYELADAMSEGNASRGDWDGFREHWWSAWLAALAQEQPGAGASSHPEGVAAVCICVATPGGLVYHLGCPFLNKDGTHE